MFALVALWPLSVLIACQNGASGGPSVPAPGGRGLHLLGWEGPPAALVVRSWSDAAIAQAPSWTLVESPVGIVVPDSTETRDGQLIQRHVSSGTLLADGNVALLLAGPAGLTRVIVTDSTLQDVRDGNDPDGVRHDRIPAMSQGWGYSWLEGGRSYRFGAQVLFGDFVLEFGRGRGRRGPFEMLRMDPNDRLIAPPIRIPGIDGVWRGVFADGSLLFAGSFEEVPGVDSIISTPFRIVQTPSASEVPGDRASQQVLFTTGVMRDPGKPRTRSPLPFSHVPSFTVAVSGDTVWIVPSERPELVALDRSGEVLLRVDWDPGDRAVPAGLTAGAGLERFPAVSALMAGSDGRVYVQRWSVQAAQGPQWLVFDPSGDLLGRLEIPRTLRVLAFGTNTVLIKGTNDEGVDEVRLHKLESRQPPGGTFSPR